MGERKDPSISIRMNAVTTVLHVDIVNPITGNLTFFISAPKLVQGNKNDQNYVLFSLPAARIKGRSTSGTCIQPKPRLVVTTCELRLVVTTHN